MANLETYKGENPDSIRKALENSNLTKLVADKMGVDQFIEAALMLLRTPALMECTKESIMGGLLKAAIFNFRISQELGQCWLVPRTINTKLRDQTTGKDIYAKVAVFQIGYKGWMELAMRSGKVESFDYGVAWERDDFDFEQGTSAFLKHKPTNNPANRGKRTHVWAGAYMIGSGRLAFHVSDIDTVERHRLMSDTQKETNKYIDQSVWYNHYDQMAIRIPMRYLCQLKLPKSVEMLDAIESDESVNSLSPEGLVVIQQKELSEVAPPELHDDYLSMIEACKTQEELKVLWEDQKGQILEELKPVFYDAVNAKFKSLAQQLLSKNEQHGH